jgi:hypothetical protein
VPRSVRVGRGSSRDSAGDYRGHSPKGGRRILRFEKCSAWFSGMRESCLQGGGP